MSRTLWGLVFVAVCWPPSLLAQPDKQILRTNLSVFVTNADNRPIQGATVTVDGPSGVQMNTDPIDGIYSFATLESGAYDLRVVTPYFEEKSVPNVQVEGLTYEYQVKIALDVSQFPDELLNDFVNFDLDLDGVLSLEEAETAFPTGTDAFWALEDACACPLIPREIARLVERPFLTVSPVRAYGAAAYPGLAFDFDTVTTNSPVSRNLMIRNEGGGRLHGSVSLNPEDGAKQQNSGFRLDPTQVEYDLSQDESKSIALELNADEAQIYTGILSLSGNYDNKAVLVGIRGTAIDVGDGEPSGCFAPRDNSQDLASGGMMTLLLLGVFGTWNRREHR